MLTDKPDKGKNITYLIGGGKKTDAFIPRQQCDTVVLIILIFQTHRCYKISRGIPSTRALNTRGWFFFANIALFSEMVRDRPVVTMEH